MTDRSNYGPVRRLSPVSADNRKPYSRTGLKGVLGTLDLNSGDAALPTTPDSPYYPFHVETPQLEAPSQNRPVAAPDGPRDIPGFPTYEQYLRIEEEYLTSLSERKQPKALISQALFDKIFAVLQNGSEDRASTAQFRFWVRKMFVFAYPQTSFFNTSRNVGGGSGSGRQSSSSSDPVVLHDKRPVAIKEQLYEVLCYCHAMARHGGRDKTCATLRLNYSWVPKELTAKFVKACPTCTLKRSGNPDLLSQFGQAVHSHSHSQPLPPYAPPPPLTLRSPMLAAEPALLFPGGPNDSPPSLSFVVGSASGDEANGGGGGSVALSGFGSGPSIFATPDLSVYPSPTLSTGSFGPMTPSPYLHSGLFGYPAVFDPGHSGSLYSVAGWDPSPLSPCGVPPMYAEELRAAGIIVKHEHEHEYEHAQPVSADEIIDMRARGMQLHLPTPKAVRAMRTRVQSCEGGSGGGSEGGEGEGEGDGRGLDTFSGAVGTPCPVDMSNIDPALLGEGGYPSLTLVGPPADSITGPEVEVDADADMDPCASTVGAGGEPYFHSYATTWETPTPVVLGASSCPMQMQGLTATATHGRPPQPPPPSLPLPLPLPIAMPMLAVAAPRPTRRGGILLCGASGRGAHEEDAEGVDVDVDVDILKDVEEDVDLDEVLHHRMPLPIQMEDARWDSPEAWLVQSDSMDDAVV